jgi:RNA polymerase sigma-70 factor (ECF subfamily)
VLSFVDGLRARDPATLAELFRDMNPRLLRMLASHGMFGDSAEELVHSCWETFFAGLDKFEGRSKVQTFVFGILLNKLRENRRHTARFDLEDDPEKVLNQEFSPKGWWIREPADPHVLLARKELGASIHKCLDGLPDSQREAFLLVETGEESSAEACRVLGVSPANLRVLLFRAKTRLRACLEGMTAHS